MKIKYFVLTMMLSFACVLGCACDEEQSQSSSGGNSSDSGNGGVVTPPAVEEPVAPEANTVISLNQSSVTFCVGETFTLVAEAKNMPDAVFSWAIDGDADSEVVSLSPIENTAVITALKKGTTKLVASIRQGEEIFFKTVEVEVKEKNDVSLIVSNNVGFDGDGYCAKLSTLSAAGSTSIVPIISVYKNNEIVPNVVINWRSENASIAKTDGNKFIAVSEGSTDVVGTYQIDGTDYSVRIKVEVSRPIIELSESFEIETENLSPLQISSKINGSVKDVVYNGKSVGDYNNKTVTLDKSKLPTVAAELGEDRQLFIETSLARYAINVDMYTKILKTKDDLDNLGELSKKAADNAAIWDGYFVLGKDIVYNGVYQSKIADLDSLWAAVEGNWFNGGLYGFKGVIDGKGHNIEGMTVDNGAQLGSMVGVLHIEGVIKNLSFTKATVAANSSLVCGAGGGSVENVYVQYDSVGAGAQHYEADGVSINTHCATFFGFKEPTATANITNCVVDVTKATFNTATSIKLVGSEYVSAKNAFVLGGSQDLQKSSGATLCFNAVIDFVENSNAQARYQKFDDAFWSMEKGVPVSKFMYGQICDQDVAFQETVACLVSGTSYQFPVNSSFVKITSDNANVVVQSGIASIAQSVTTGETVTIVASSIFDETKFDSFTCSLAKVTEEVTDLTKGENVKTAFYDLTEEKVYFADLADQVTDEVLYYLNADYTMATFGKDGDAEKAIIAVTANKFYKFNCKSVTKVIDSADDLHKLRRNYTVESYGNKGCYDSKILGTFVLINNIDCTGLTLENTGSYWENSRGFGGTLDGRGYTISNLSVGKNGLFGVLSYATIKDVNFEGVRLTSEGDGGSVSLFATRVFNTAIENVNIQFVEYVLGEYPYGTSGLMFYEASFDSTFKNMTLDISQLSGVKYLTECYYAADIPYHSEKKSTYENITVIVSNLDELPAFAYKAGTGAANDEVEYPEGSFTFKLPEVETEE